LQGIVRGTPAGEVVLEKIMNDEAVQPGDIVRTSGGDRIFPKGLPVGTVTRVSNGTGSDLFLNIRVRPAANLSKLEEVLVVTKLEERDITPAEVAPVRAADILSQRLPSVPDKPATPAAPVANGAAKPAQAAPLPKGPDKNPAPGAPQPNAIKTGDAAPPPVVRTQATAGPKVTTPASSSPNSEAGPATLQSATEHQPAPAPVKVAEQTSKPKPNTPVAPPPAKPQDGPR